MRKKILVSLLVGVMAATGVAGLTACNPADSGLPKGEEVTAEKWKSAFEKTASSENYTAESVMIMKQTMTGTVEGKTVNATATSESAVKVYFDLAGKKIYTETKYSEKFTGLEDIGEEDGESTSERKSYLIAENKTIWSSEYSASTNKWTAEKSEYSSEAEVKQNLSYSGVGMAFAQTYKTSETAEASSAKPLADLYSAFTYSGGFYKATVWTAYTESTKIDLTVTVKDGYVSGIEAEASEEETENGVTETSESKAVYKFSEFGKTSVNAPADAVKAINDKKAEEQTPPAITSVAGKTFVFHDLTAEYDSTVSDETKKKIEKQIAEIKENAAGVEIIFGEDNTFSMVVLSEQMEGGTYTQDGANLVLTINGSSQNFTLSGDSLILSMSEEGVTMKQTYKPKNA
ncbi:MAG: hypothetical protein K2L42_04995 [Clostridia bacterium]|nr:hypothetical protein [Clostridia bacterium]